MGLAFEESQTAGGPWRGSLFMIRLVNLVFFLGCALAVAHYYGLGSMGQVLAAVAVTAGLMRLLSGKRDPLRSRR